MTCRLVPFVVLILAFAAPLAAQVTPGQAGFAFVVNGTPTGSLCGGGFTCTPAATTAAAGDVVSLLIHGAPAAPYAIFVSPTAGQCQSFPGIVNSLVLGGGISLATTGILDEPSPILACPAGRETLAGTFPALPPGTTFVMQVLTYGSGFFPGFTQAISVTAM